MLLNEDVEILPIARTMELNQEMLESIKSFMDARLLQPKYVADNDFGTFFINNQRLEINLILRRYDIMPEGMWLIEFGKMLACFQELGYKFLYEPQISN